MKRLSFLVLLLLATLASCKPNGPKEYTYETAPAVRGYLVQYVTASGSLSAVVSPLVFMTGAVGRNLNEFSRTIRDNPAALIQSRPSTDAAGVSQ